MKSMLLVLVLITTAATAAIRPSGTALETFYGKEFYMSFPNAVTKEMLHQLLNSTNQVVLGYTGARKIMFGQLYKNTDNRGHYVTDVYCHKNFYFNDVDDALNMHSDVNTEHTWPQSKFSGRFNKEMQKSDLHHLFPTDSEANSKRANFDFGEVADGENELNMRDCDPSALGHSGGEHFAPPAPHRGNVARALFYFATRYNMNIDKNQEAYLRKWHKADPVDELELKRHETIFSNQKNRNPFVDHPELVDVIKDF